MSSNDSDTTEQRRPRWVFSEGDEPDPRFSLANERTFLAWIRTSMAFIAAGVAFHAVTLQIPDGIKLAVSVLLLVAGVVMPPFAWIKRGLTERAMRKNKPLPNSMFEEYAVGALLVVIGILLGIGLSLG
jgi:putative membrane protein